MAINFGIKYFHPYVYGTKFLVKSDHKPLQYLFSLKDPTSKLARIRLELSEYDFEIEHIPGKENVSADALSRISIDDLTSIHAQNEAVIRAMTTRSMSKNVESEHQTQEVSKGLQVPISNYSIRKCPVVHFSIVNTNNEIQFSFLLKCERNIKSKIFTCEPNNTIQSLRILLAELEHLMVRKRIFEARVYPDDNIFSLVDKTTLFEHCNETLQKVTIWIMLPITEVSAVEKQQQILEHFHTHPLEGGHIGQKKLYHKIRSKYTWPGLSKDVAKMVKSCKSCHINKPKLSNKEHMIITETPSHPFHTISIDTIGPFATTINRVKYAITIICDFSKYLIIVPVPNKEAKTVAKVLIDHCFLQFGPVRVIKSDLGTEFANSMMQELTTMLEIQHNMSTAYHHQSLGCVERSHRTLNEYLRNYMSTNEKEWERLVRYFCFCYNTSPNVAINMYSPFELVYGHRPNSLCNLGDNDPNTSPDSTSEYIKKLKFNLELAHKRTKEFLDSCKVESKHYYDKRCKALNVKLGDKVFLTNEVRNKSDPYYTGPYVVTDIYDNGNVNININGKEYTTHKNRLRKY